MVFRVKQNDVEGAIAEQEEYLCEVGEGDVFPEEVAELLCGISYLEACGLSESQIYDMTLADVLERYRSFLQEDAP